MTAVKYENRMSNKQTHTIRDITHVVTPYENSTTIGAQMIACQITSIVSHAAAASTNSGTHAL